MFILCRSTILKKESCEEVSGGEFPVVWPGVPGRGRIYPARGQGNFGFGGGGKRKGGGIVLGNTDNSERSNLQKETIVPGGVRHILEKTGVKNLGKESRSSSLAGKES